MYFTVPRRNQCPRGRLVTIISPLPKWPFSWLCFIISAPVCLLLPPIAFHGHQSTQWGPEQKLPSVNSKSQEAKATTSLLLLNLGTLSASTPIHHHIMRVVLQTKLSEIFRYEIVKTLFILPPLSNNTDINEPSEKEKVEYYWMVICGRKLSREVVVVVVDIIVNIRFLCTTFGRIKAPIWELAKRKLNFRVIGRLKFPNQQINPKLTRRNYWHLSLQKHNSLTLYNITNRTLLKVIR